MSDSLKLGLPYLAASQAQKHVTHNEALSILDGLIQLAVNSRGQATPPATPVDGDRYLIAAAATGDWLGRSGQIALRMEGAWRYFTASEGWRLWVSDEDVLLVFNGATWNAGSVPTSLQNTALVGVNTTADATNKLAVSSSATLFNHAGNGHQMKLNKNTAADTASMLFQTSFSGRAEIGTTGDDDFHFKVSADGSTFSEALVLAAASGRVTIPNTAVLQPQAADPAAPVNGQLWYNSTTAKLRTFQNGQSVDVIVVAPPSIDLGGLLSRHLIMN